MESANIIPVTIEEEMRGSYMDYAMSVIISRALPDVRDGMKPVHRRILYAMLREGLTSNRKFSKCAGVVGEVLKKYHPHGDSAVYHALVRMAQHWNLRYPLIEGQGNFGSVDGDSPAAYRYTECKMQALTDFVMSDIDKNTVDFQANFDDTTLEPKVLPSRIPNLLVNGAEGIAVGMVSSIPPHNLGEVISALQLLIKNPEAGLAELMACIPGPDFPTAGIIYGASQIPRIYSTGKGILKLRARTHLETLKTGKREAQMIVVDEIPYQVNKARLVEKIADLVNEKRVDGVSRLRDESDRRGMRIVIELKRDAVPDVVLNQLYKHSPLQSSYGVTMRAIVDGRPRILSLKAALECFLEHRRTVVIRRTRFDLEKARARVHILEGYLIALDNIDDVIATIRESESTQIAREKLQARFSLSEIQAQHILDMPLKRLTGLERKAIEDEFKSLQELIAELTKILSSGLEVDRVINEELEEIRGKYTDKRRTSIEESGEDIDDEDLIAEEDMVVTISHRGYVKRCSPSVYKAQNRGGKGVQGTKKLESDGGDDDFISEMFIASTHSYLLVFTSLGRMYWIKVYSLPEAGRTARGRALVNMIQLDDNETVSAILPVREFKEDNFVFMTTRAGVVKRVNLMDLSNVRRIGIKATLLDEGDELVSVKLTDGKQDCILSTKSGLSIRFFEDDARVMGRVTRGVRGIRLEDEDNVVDAVTVPQELEDGSQVEDSEEQVTLLTVCSNGYGKRTRISQYRRQSRGGKGIIDIKTSDRNGPVVASKWVEDSDQVMLITTSGKVIRIPVSSVSVVGRNTQGVRLINLEEGETVAAVARIADVEGADELAVDDGASTEGAE
ncbi:MAG: DNA gyrase subunit A [bacterium]|nr:DNA gyrase subunit A [bacterium]